MNPINILYLHSHDTGRYIQPYGVDVPTPNLQALAAGGVLFRQACCAAPTCSPSRASLLTGLWPHCCGMTGLAHRGFALNDYGRHIVHTLKAAGYETALFGVQHVAAKAETIGYDRVATSQEGLTGAVKDFLHGPHAKPFFMSVGYSETHRPYPSPAPADDERYVRPPAPMPDAPTTRRDFAAYRTMARRMDEKMGAVLAELDAAGLADNTLVICTTDHGIAWPTMKCNLTDHGIGVMLIIRGPGGFSGGKVRDAMVSHVDIFPTICELIGIDPPAWLAGVSLMPLVRGHVEQVRDELFAEVTYHAAYEPMRAVRTPRWKYIRRFGDRRTPVLSDCDASATKDIWMAAGWGDRILAEEELYDLLLDPNEMRNLAAAPAAGAALADMRARLERYMKNTDDPLLAGDVPPPPGAVVNHPDCTEPSEKRFIPT